MGAAMFRTVDAPNAASDHVSVASGSLDRYATAIAAYRGGGSLLTPDSPLLIERVPWRGRFLETFYAPFEHLESEARVVIVGLTPGRRQAEDALTACGDALRAGRDRSEALRLAKRHASFSGPMRSNLVRMLDAIGVARLVGVDTAARFWDEAAGSAHFTSLIRNPVLVDGANWSGSPDPVGTPPLRRWMESWTGRELAGLSPAVVVPLGPVVARGLAHLADLGMISPGSILADMPHPSGANAERVACFLGRKPPHLASAGTDGDALVAARARLTRQVDRIGSEAATSVRPGSAPDRSAGGACR